MAKKKPAKKKAKKQTAKEAEPMSTTLADLIHEKIKRFEDEVLLLQNLKTQIEADPQTFVDEKIARIDYHLAPERVGPGQMHDHLTRRKNQILSDPTGFTQSTISDLQSRITEHGLGITKLEAERGD